MIPRAVKSQAVANLLVQFPKEEEYILSEKMPRKVVIVEIHIKKQTMRFVKAAFNEHA